MRETLINTYSDSEREIAASVGAAEGPIEDKIRRLFADLYDPLLTAVEIAEMLDLDVGTSDQLEVVLQQLVDSRELESTTTTQRALDSGDVVLYRGGHASLHRLRVLALATESEDLGTVRLQFKCRCSAD